MEPDERIKAGADRYTLYYGDIRRLLSSEYAAEVRWITASLFALNAGGLVSLSGKNLSVLTQWLAGFSFWVGVLLAFGFVLYSQYKTKKFLDVIQHIENCWVVSAATGKLDEERLKPLEKEKKNIDTKFSSYFSIGSFLMFSIGLYLLACTK